MIVGIDSMVLIYAQQAHAKADSPEAELSARAIQLLQKLADDETRIVLPAICVSEILVPVMATQQGGLIAAFSRRFVCCPFDLPAAAIAAELWAKHKAMGKAAHYERRVLKADAMIIASAKAAGATVFYSHDKKCRDLADLVMTAKDLPLIDKRLFDPTHFPKGGQKP